VLYDDHMMPVIIMMMVVLGMDLHISVVADHHRVSLHEWGKRKEGG
jgi:hypothetical protein